MDEKHIRTILATAAERIEGKSVATVISEIAKEAKDLKAISLENQYAMGAVLCCINLIVTEEEEKNLLKMVL